MKDVRRVPASAGAEWLLGGFRLLRQAPLGLGLLGAIYGAIALMVPLSLAGGTTLFLLLEVLLLLIGPLVIGGLVYAARAVDSGERALPGHLLQGPRAGKLARLMATLLPQMLAVVVCGILLAVMIGASGLVQLQQVVEHMQAQSTPDSTLLQSLPLGRLLLWVVLVALIGVIASFFTFVAIPEIMFTQSSALDAMRSSFRACMRNLSAMIVFLVLAVIAVIAVYIAVMLVAVMVRLVLGDQAMQVVAQVLATAVLMPVLTGAMYHAWKHMLSDANGVPVAAGFEA